MKSVYRKTTKKVECVKTEKIGSEKLPCSCGVNLVKVKRT